MRLPVRALIVAALLPVAAGCGAIKHAAINNVASVLSKSGTSVTSDDDPDLVGQAIPFTIKLYEGLLESIPDNREFLLATCALSTQYGYAYLESDADILGEPRHDEAVALRERALNMYLRGRKYCLRALDRRFEHISKDLAGDQATMEHAVARFKDKKDVPMLYWTAASWGAAISLGKDKPLIAIDFPVVRALAERALALDESYNAGALHEMMITLDSLPEALGGNAENARKHFDRAVELQKGLSPGPYVAFAMGVAQPAQDREQFTKLINQALAIDPEKDPNNRLVTKLTQRRAKALLDQIDSLFTAKQDVEWPARWLAGLSVLRGSF
jgi:predicted anti-sigma-YlaC factor YlaD